MNKHLTELFPEYNNYIITLKNHTSVYDFVNDVIFNSKELINAHIFKYMNIKKLSYHQLSRLLYDNSISPFLENTQVITKLLLKKALDIKTDISYILIDLSVNPNSFDKETYDKLFNICKAKYFTQCLSNEVYNYIIEFL